MCYRRASTPLLKPLSQFRSFDLAQGEDGNSLEFERDDRRVVFLVFDTRRLCYAELCVLIADGEGLDEATTRIFTERAGIASAISHPGWAALFESGVDDGVFYYAREFIDGERLSAYAERVGLLPDRLALEIVILLGEAFLALEEFPGVLAEVDLYEARLFCDVEGRMSVKIPGFPLEPLPRRPPDSGAAVSSRLTEVLRRLSPRCGNALRSERDPGDGEACSLATLRHRLVEMCERSPRQPLEADLWPQRKLANEIYQRRKPKEFLSSDYSSVPNAEDPWNPYSQTLVGPKGKVLRLQVLPPPRLLRDDFLTFQKAGTQPAAIAMHAQWKNDDFRLLAEETAPGRSLAHLLTEEESLSPAESAMLLERIAGAIGDLEEGGVTIPDFRPENVFVCFEEPGSVDLEALTERRPVTAWPEFHVRLRTHLTMSGLTHPPDVWGNSASANAVFEYLSLRGQGLRERASQLQEDVAMVAAQLAVGKVESREPEAEAFVPGAGSIFFAGTGRVEEAPPSPEEATVDWDDEVPLAEVHDEPVMLENDRDVGDGNAADWDEDAEEPVAVWGEMGLVRDYPDLDVHEDDDLEYYEDGDDEWEEGDMDWDPDDENIAAFAGPVLSPIAAAVAGDDRGVEHDAGEVAEWESLRRGSGWLWVIMFLVGAALCGIAIAHYTGQGFWVK